MAAKPLGFYGLDLEEEVEKAIDALPLHELTDLLHDMTFSLNVRHYMDDDKAPEIFGDKPVTPDELSDSQKISLIRGLCDRIETKLMEIAR